VIEHQLEARPLVAVLLATHNPNSFLAEQIDSIRQQIGVDVRIYWGDFGSSEKTKNYIRSLLFGMNYLEFVIKEPGPAANFFFLLSHTKEDFISFCDQDDVWISNKLINQVRSIESYTEIPTLTHSNSQLLVNGEIRQKKSICMGHEFKSLMFTNCCQGCTLMINKKAQQILLANLPSNVVWHDWWIAMVVSATGKILFTNDVQVLYRIHPGNTIGIPKINKRFINFLRRPEGLISQQLLNALERYNSFLDLTSKEIRLVNSLTSTSAMQRLRACMVDRKRRITVLDDLMRRFAWILRRP
jgi:glycosyltransferase involved in cell wall biosynthesis